MKAPQQDQQPLPWPARWRWPLALVMAVLVGVLAWQVSDRFQRAGLEPSTREEQPRYPMPEPGEVLRDVLAERDQRVVVHSSLQDSVDPAQVKQARRLLQRSGKPLWIFVIPNDEAINGGYTSSGAAEILASRVLGERPGYLMVLNPDGSSDLEERGDLSSQYVETRGQTGATLVRVAREMITWDTDPTAEDR